MSEPTKPSPKSLALAAIQDAIDESGRAGGPRPLVLNALLTEARRLAHEIQELVRARKPKKPKAATRESPKLGETVAL